MQPIVSIVTPCYNSASTIEDTLQSVLSQSYAPIEYVVMDAASNDGTQDIVRRYASRLTLVSEPDRGQSDAINKGWRLAKGDILAWLNADDLYFPDTVQRAVDYLETHPETAWVYGDSVTLDGDGRPAPFRHIISAWEYSKLLERNDFVVQPTVFLRRKVFEDFGGPRHDLHYTMDYEYWLRIGKRYPGVHVPEIRAMVKWFRTTKTSSGGVRRLDEMLRMLAEYGVTEIPVGHRPEWAETYWGELLRNLVTFKWPQLTGNARALARYPGFIVRGFFKLMLRSFVPPRVETLLRQAIVRKQVHRG